MKEKKNHHRLLALLLTAIMVIGLLPANVVAEESQEKTISSAEDFPSAIAEGETYTLAADITLSADQQISKLAGTLDGKGHTITLSGKPLADTITGTVQNLGVTGKALGDAEVGSFALNFSGTIQNCFSTATVSTSDWLADPAGFVANMTGGEIRNSYFAGDAGYGGAFVTGGTVAKLSHTVAASSGSYGNSTGIYGSGQQFTDCHKISSSDIESWSDAISVLNTDIPETGYTWVLPEGAALPVLQAGDSTVETDWTALNEAIEKAQALSADGYTTASWENLQTCLSSALELKNNADATQAEVNAKAASLNDAINALAKEKTTKPVSLPDDDSIIKLSSVAELEAIDGETEGKYYVLTQDLTLDDTYSNWLFDDFEGVLDGQGHTITFNGASRLFPWADIGENGVVQNVQFQGKLGYTGNGVGVLGSYLKGAVINCSSNITPSDGSTASGFARYLDGGVISNCYVIGTPGNAFVATYNSGKIVNSYWSEDISNPVASENMTSCWDMATVNMRTMEFVDLMNQNRGDNGLEWGQSSNGYPYFGDNVSYTEPGKETTDYSLIFTPYNSEEAKDLTDGTLTILAADVNSLRKAGTLAVKDYTVPEGYSIKWSWSNENIRTAEDEGSLYAYQIGSSVIKANLTDGDGQIVKTLAAVTVSVIPGKVEDIKLYIDGNDVTNGSYTVAGSESRSISVRVKYADEDTYREAAYSQFTYKVSDNNIYSIETSPEFYFLAPGSGTMTVVYKEDSSLSATVQLTSTYVAATSVTPGISGTYTIHGRNANDWQSSPPRFNPVYNGVTVEPSNASYNNRAYWTITSSDESVGIAMEDGYVPVSAGTVTYTATLTDPTTGESISGSSTVTYNYENPLTDLSIEKDSFEIENNTELTLPLQYTGAKDEEGWSISEPSINWTYSTDGIVTISRKNANGDWKRDETAPDNNMFIASSEYTLYATGEGTVTVTGTPVDMTGGAQPISFTVTVKAGQSAQEVDIDRIVKEGIESSVDYLENQETSYEYGNEWLVFSLLRAGEEIPEEDLENYYNSVVKEVSGWNADQKPTNIARVALALAAMGKDITDIGGVDLAAMLYNHPDLDGGSNDLTYALIALDAVGAKIPDDAAWSREKIIEKILSYQNEDGGISLFKNNSSGIDTTAMSLQALASYTEDENVQTAVNNALTYLKSQLSMPLYGYGTAEGEAQVIMALSVLKLDPIEAGFGTVYRNIFSHLEDTYKVAEGGFSHAENGDANNMATLQVLQALESYRRYAADEKSIWDMAENTDTPDVNPEDQDKKPDDQKPSDTDDKKDNDGSDTKSDGTGTAGGSNTGNNSSTGSTNITGGAVNTGSVANTGSTNTANSTGSTDSTASSPKTGDESNMVLWSLVSILSLLAVVHFGRRKKQQGE